jgi:ATP-dependent exoDNAse (exonuclease V) beta subunit
LNKLLPEWKISSLVSENEFDEENYIDQFVEQEADTNSVIKSSGIQSEKIGELIHKILQLELSEDKSNEFIENQIKAFYPMKKNADKIISEIKEILKKFRQSDVYAEISAFKNFRNEYEIYLKQNSYFLHGIIDKLIFENNKILIIDYKTDDVNNKTASQKFKEYSNQLKFYLYISSFLFKDYENFEARLIFLKMPELKFTISYSRENISELKKEIAALIEGIISADFPKNLEHCNLCHFSTSGKCIVN